MIEIAATIVTAIIAIGFWQSHDAADWVRRVASAGALLSVAALVALGASWPSGYTVLAILALPAVVILIIRVVRPTSFHGRWPLRYLRFTVVLPPAAFALQSWWLNGGCEAVGKCL